MEKLKTRMRFEYIDTKKAFIIFWGIVICWNILGYIGNFLFQNINFGIKQDGLYTMVGSNYMTIAIYIIVTGIVMYTETFPALIGFGSTRKDFYKGSILYYVLLSLAMTIIQITLMKIEQVITSSLGLEIYHGYGLNGIEVFFAFFLLCAVFNLLGVIIYRIGYWTWIVIGIVLAFIFLIGLRVNIVSFYNTVLAGNLLIYILTIILLSAVLFFIGWLLIRKHDLNIKS